MQVQTRLYTDYQATTDNLEQYMMSVDQKQLELTPGMEVTALVDESDTQDGTVLRRSMDDLKQRQFVVTDNLHNTITSN